MNFILRRVSGKNVQMNQIIGDGYTLIDRQINPNEFRDMFKNVFNEEHVADLDKASNDNTKRCYAFVCNDSFQQPLYMSQYNYIMTDGGKTFANLSYK